MDNRSQNNRRGSRLDAYLENRKPDNYRDALNYLNAQISKLILVEGKIRNHGEDLRRRLEPLGEEKQSEPSYDFVIESSISRVSEAKRHPLGKMMHEKMLSSNPSNYVVTGSLYTNNGDTQIKTQKIGKDDKSAIEVRLANQVVARNDSSFSKYLDISTVERVLHNVLKPAIKEISEKIAIAEEAEAKLGAEVIKAKYGTHPKIMKEQENAKISRDKPKDIIVSNAPVITDRETRKAAETAARLEKFEEAKLKVNASIKGILDKCENVSKDAPAAP